MRDRASWEEFAENYYNSKRDPFTSELEEKLDKIEQLVKDYDGTIPSMIKQFSEIQKVLEEE